MNWRLIKNQNGKTVLQKRIKAQAGAMDGWETIAQCHEISDLLNVLDTWELQPGTAQDDQ
jgi:hypothetical protein